MSLWYCRTIISNSVVCRRGSNTERVLYIDNNFQGFDEYLYNEIKKYFEDNQNEYR